MSLSSQRSVLDALYGPAAEGIDARVEDLIVRYRPLLPAPPAATRHPLPLSQEDAILITYPDQLLEPGVPPLRTLASFAERHLRQIVSGIHILPFYPWSSDDGFAVKDFFSVHPAYGSWGDISQLGADFDLMFDAVFNHVSAQGSWFQAFLADEPKYRDFFITVQGKPDLSAVIRPRVSPVLTTFSTAAGPRQVWTTFSADQADLNFRNPDVLLAVLEALLLYVRHGARYIRLDAIAFLWKEIGTPCLHLPQTHLVIQLMRRLLDQIAPHVLLITETNVPHAENLSYFGDGRNEAQLVYNFALPPLVLHSLLTGNAEKLSHWAKSLLLPSHSTTFFNFLASHDGIGLNPVRGILTDSEVDALVAHTLARGGLISSKTTPQGSQLPYELNINYLDALSPPTSADSPEFATRKMLTAHAILLSLRGVPGIYFHSLFGSRGNPAEAAQTGIARRINRQKLECGCLETELTDPSSLRARVFNGVRNLLHTRRAHPALAPAAPQRVLELHPSVFAVLRESADGSDRLLCLHNVSPETVTLPPSPCLSAPQSLPPYGHRWLGF